MIRGVHIARYRGIRELTADGFGRVNLIIGKNDCGKTAFMEAVRTAEDAEDAAHHFRGDQRSRLGRKAKIYDFERFWRPLFFDFDAKAGLSISIVGDEGEQKSLELTQGGVSQEIISDREQDLLNADETEDVIGLRAWALDLSVTSRQLPKIQQRIVATGARLRMPALTGELEAFWALPGGGADIGKSEIRYISILKQRGQDSVLLELLREIDGRLSAIELLAPEGGVAEPFVRLDNGTPMLPVRLMGEGFQRCFELGVGAAANDWPTLFVDEVENGIHHVVLEPLWRWLATLSLRRNLQVFATTHSEECIHAACRAFRGMDDDGLRVIRLDRLERETRATIYDRALIEVAERTGTEIRG